MILFNRSNCYKFCNKLNSRLLSKNSGENGKTPDRHVFDTIHTTIPRFIFTQIVDRLHM